MYGEHGYAAHLRRCGHSARHRIGDVVELQIEEGLKAKARETVNRPRALCREKLTTYLEQTTYATESPRQGLGLTQTLVIERDNQS